MLHAKFKYVIYFLGRFLLIIDLADLGDVTLAIYTHEVWLSLAKMFQSRQCLVLLVCLNLTSKSTAMGDFYLKLRKSSKKCLKYNHLSMPLRMICMDS